MSLEKGAWELITPEDAEKTNAVDQPGKKEFFIGQMVQVNYKGNWFSGEVIGMPSEHFLDVSYEDPETKENVENQFLRRCVRDIDDRKSTPEYKSGDKVLVRTESRGEFAWEPGEVQRVAGRYIYIILEADRRNPEIEPKNFFSPNVTHLSGRELSNLSGNAKYDFETGDLVEWKTDEQSRQGTVIKYATKHTVVIRYFDTISESYKEDRVAAKDLKRVGDSTTEPVSNGARTWTSADGKYTIQGELIEVIDDKVKIRSNAGNIITVLREKLSSTDQEFISKFESPKNTPSKS